MPQLLFITFSFRSPSTGRLVYNFIMWNKKKSSSRIIIKNLLLCTPKKFTTALIFHHLHRNAFNASVTLENSTQNHESSAKLHKKKSVFCTRNLHISYFSPRDIVIASDVLKQETANTNPYLVFSTFYITTMCTNYEKKRTSLNSNTTVSSSTGWDIYKRPVRVGDWLGVQEDQKEPHVLLNMADRGECGWFAFFFSREKLLEIIRDRDMAACSVGINFYCSITCRISTLLPSRRTLTGLSSTPIRTSSSQLPSTDSRLDQTQ